MPSPGEPHPQLAALKSDTHQGGEKQLPQQRCGTRIGIRLRRLLGRAQHQDQPGNQFEYQTS
jgi:hypothetical protein